MKELKAPDKVAQKMTRDGTVSLTNTYALGYNTVFNLTFNNTTLSNK